jgi:hypothetical protein
MKLGLFHYEDAAYIFRFFEDWVLRRISAPKREDVTVYYEEAAYIFRFFEDWVLRGISAPKREDVTVYYEEAAYIFRFFEDWVLRGISAPKREDLTEGGANGIIKSFIIHSLLFTKHDEGDHVTYVEENGAACACRILVRKPEGKGKPYAWMTGYRVLK